MLRPTFLKKDGYLLLACLVLPKARSHTHTHRNTAHTKAQHTQRQKEQYNTKRCQNIMYCWAEARIKIARMTLTIKLDGNWSSFQLANCAPPLGVTDSAIAPSARMPLLLQGPRVKLTKKRGTCLSSCFGSKASLDTHLHHPQEEATKAA